MKCEINGLPHMQYTTATVWNTSLINFALQEAGLSPADPMVKKSKRLFTKSSACTSMVIGLFTIHHGLPGGWGFSDINTIQS